MKNTIFFMLTAILLFQLLILAPAQAQTDTLKTEYAEESAESSDYSLKEKYDYLIRSQVEEKKMFKIGISEIGGAIGFGLLSINIVPNISYEQKLSPAFSILLDNRLRTGDDPTSNNYQLSIGGRYYYNMVKRIKEGVAANNFSGNYFSLQQTTTLYFNQLDVEPFYFSFLYGFQRRLGKVGYVDLNFGPAYTNDVRREQTLIHRFGLDLNFSIGLGF